MMLEKSSCLDPRSAVSVFPVKILGPQDNFGDWGALSERIRG